MGWERLADEGEYVVYHGYCSHCGNLNRVYRAHWSDGGPPYTDTPDHSDLSMCVEALNKRIIRLEKENQRLQELEHGRRY